MNHFVQTELDHKFSYDDLFLLALSGQVPIDKLLLRLQNIKHADVQGQVQMD
jgi:hypothetical protein